MDTSDEEEFDFEGSLDDVVYDGRPECTISGFCRVDGIGAQFRNCHYCRPGIPNPDPLEGGIDYTELGNELNEIRKGDEE